MNTVKTMLEPIRNLEEVIDKAIKTGEKVITMQCPCCGKIFYAVESEAAYQYDNLASQDTLKLKHLGRKCPHCGYAGGFDLGLKSKYEQDVEQMRVEMEAEKLAEDAADKRQVSWSEINNIGVFNK